MLTNDENSVIYNGPSILNECEIIRFCSKTAHFDTKTSFIYSFKFQRLYVQHLMTTFFQSCLLWILPYITLFIDEEDFSNQFMGAVTALLVLAALLSSIGDTLPKTAYFKFIDLWFNWFIGNIFLIILIHVVIDYRRKKQKLEHETDIMIRKSSHVLPLFKNTNPNTDLGETNTGGAKLNKLCKILIPGMTGLFISVYFALNTFK
jgi:hypothetical protein